MASNKIASPLTLGGALLGLMLPYAGHAAPAASVSGQFAKSDVLLVAESVLPFTSRHLTAKVIV
jgi:hypothetical protein